MISPDLVQFLQQKAVQYNCPSFIADDPVSIPHRYHRPEDREIAGLFAATLAWGRRDLILRSAQRLMALMDDAPFDFVLNATPNDLNCLSGFVHRTFNGEDAVHFVLTLRRIYTELGGPEAVFAQAVAPADSDLTNGLRAWHRAWHMLLPTGTHALKHIPNIGQGSAAKRTCLFLRWMVRVDNQRVDFGIWKRLKTSQLVLPLDVHTGRVSRALGILDRKQDDWRAAQEVTANLRILDAEDPCRFDFALFCLGALEKGAMLSRP